MLALTGDQNSRRSGSSRKKGAAAAQASAQEFTIKFATLAPEGSTWITVMKEYDQAIRKESGGRLGFKIYAGGVAGDADDGRAREPERGFLGREISAAVADGERFAAVDGGYQQVR